MSPSADRLHAVDRLQQHALRLGGVAPASDPHPLVRLQVLVMGEEVLDLLPDYLGQVLGPADVRIIRKGRIDRNGQQLLVAAMLVFEEQDGNRPRPDDAPGKERSARKDKG